MSKRKLTLSVNDDLVKEARKYNINLSSFLEIKLREYLALIDRKQTTYSQSGNKNNEQKTQNNNRVGLLRFELKSMAPEATRMPSYPTGPRHINAIKNRVIRFITNQIII